VPPLLAHAEKIQRVLDEYLGTVGSAAIVSRAGRVLFQSAASDAAAGLFPAFDEVPPPAVVEDEPGVVNLPVSHAFCSYGVSLGGDLVMFVIAENAVAPGAITARMKKAALLLRRVIGGGVVPSTPGHGPSGANAVVSARAPRRRAP